MYGWELSTYSGDIRDFGFIASLAQILKEVSGCMSGGICTRVYLILDELNAIEVTFDFSVI